MSEVKINYEHLKDAQKVYDCVNKHFDDFDYRGADGDRETNKYATAYVVKDLDLPIDIVSITVHNDDDEEYDAVMYHQNWPVYNELVFMTQYDWLMFDYAWPLDVVDMLNEIMGKYHKMKNRLDLVEKLTYDEQTKQDFTSHTF